MNTKINLACVVDDDSTYTYSVSRILKTSTVFNNYVVFNNGFEAMEYFKTVLKDADKIPDILFLDINMPMMDGWHFLEEFAEIKPHLAKAVTIYMVSSSILDVDINRAKKLSNVTGYIVKPINIEQFEKIFKFFEIEAA
jgi:CheY-like chemotaxis protein